VAALRQPRRSLAKALARPGLSVVAEIKRASPSKGVIRHDLEPEALLAAYEAGGADAVSIVTDREYFSGDGEILRALRARTELPLLR
jgi:indole-3-glycerol phosphate synthase